MNKTKIYIADDHAILRDGLKLILSQNDNFIIAGEASNGIQALEEIERLKPDIAVLDISMPSMTGLEIGRQIKKYNSRIKVIILSRHDNEIYIQQALQNKIDGYILKDYAAGELLRAINDVLNGDIYLSPKIITKIAYNTDLITDNHPYKTENENNNLSNREKEILKLICENNSNKQIATMLRISEQTVKAHRHNIMKKLDLHKATELTKYAIKNEIIEI